MDELKEAQRWLVEAASLLDRAQRAHVFMGIERDIVLGKLARAYELVAAASTASPLARSGVEAPAVEAPCPRCETPAPAPQPESVAAVEPQPEPTVQAQPRAAAPARPQPDPDELALAAADDLLMEIEADEPQEPAPSRQQAEIVSDRFRSRAMSINEQLGGAHAAPNRASKLQNRRIDDLGKSIGLNDKHVFIKELFDGSPERYAATINKLNHFDDLNSAIIYLQESFSWPDDSQAAVQFIDLVRRKFL